MQTEDNPAYRVERIIVGDENDREHFPGVLYRDEELTNKDAPSGAVMVEGVVRTFGFHPERLEQSRPEVVRIIREVVKDPFFKGKGDGYSFLGLCEDRSGAQWAEHPTMEALCCLAIGLKLAGWCIPREAWNVLPGGIPYVWFEPVEA